MTERLLAMETGKSKRAPSEEDEEDANNAAEEDADDEMDQISPKRRSRKPKLKPAVLSDPQYKKGLDNLQVSVL